MTDRPILFPGPMVRALLAGRKTQTRRVATGPVRFAVGDRLWVKETWARVGTVDPGFFLTRADYPACAVKYGFDQVPTELPAGDKWRPSLFMRRVDSRLTLRVTDVRVQPLQDIDEADAIAEGMIFTDFGEYIPQGRISIDGGVTFRPFKPRQHDGWHWGEATAPDQCLGSARSAYANLWNSLNDARGMGWATNPNVVAVSFDVIPGNIDQVPS